jgi:hypothetical protein
MIWIKKDVGVIAKTTQKKAHKAMRKEEFATQTGKTEGLPDRITLNITDAQRPTDWPTRIHLGSGQSLGPCGPTLAPPGP